MRFILLITLAGLLPAAAKEPPIRALLVCGGCCHDYAAQAKILRDGIQERANVQVDVVLSADKGTKPIFPMYRNADWAKGYDVVIHDECAADVKEMPYVQNIVDAHKNGLPAVNLHCAMHSYRTGTDVWFEFLGLQSSGHGPQKPIAIDFQGADHEITKSMPNWTTTGEELYNNVKIFPSATPLASGTQDGNTAVVVWTNDYHGTRVFNTTLGHNNETVEDDRYLDLVVKGLLWSCNKLNRSYLWEYSGPAGHFDVIPPATAVEKPVAANATRVRIRASSTQEDNRAANAIDGSLETRWCADGASFPQSLQIAFDKPRRLDGVKIDWEGDNNVYQHTVEGSVDGKEWKMLADARTHETAGATNDRFDPAELKFLRITCTGTSDGWACIREISVQGEGIGPLAPQRRNRGNRGAAEDPFKAAGNIRPSISALTAEQETEILKDVKLAEGFEASLFATPSAANYPVYVAASPSGDLYVSSDGNGSLGRDPNRGRILRLRDEDGDGRADQVTEFVKNVDSPRGLVWDRDRLYVVRPPDVSCYIDHDGDGQADEEKTLISGIAFGFKDRPADHTTNGLTLGIDGWLYISGGDFGFMDAVGTDGKHLQHRGGGVIRFRPDGSGLEVFSTGTRNILGTPISPLMDLFARDNTNDGGGWDVRFHHFTGLEDHGYPRMYMNFNDEVVQPLADYGGGSGCGSVYISEPGIPEKWNNAPFTCDWGTSALWHHTVTPYGATFQESAKPEALIQMTRPTDADVDGMSRIYQASWKGATFNWEGPDVGYIVQVKPRGHTPEPLPDFAKAPDGELVKWVASTSQVRSLAAQRELLSRKIGPETNQALLVLAKNTAAPLAGRVAALYTLTQALVAGPADGPAMEVISGLAGEPQLERFVLRALADAGLPRVSKGETVAPEAPFAAGLKSDDPRTQLEAIIGAARQNIVSLAPQIASHLGSSDPVIAHTAFQALARLGAADAAFAIVDDSQAPPAQVTGALRALMRMHRPQVVKGLIERLGIASHHSEILGALARLHFHEGEWKGDSWGTRPDTRGPYYQPEPWSESPAIAAVLKAELAKASPAEAAAIVRELRRNRIEFNEALDRITALAEQDRKLLPDLIDQLAVAEQVPASSEKYLIEAAMGNYPAETLSLAVVTLAKTDSADGMSASLEALERLSKMNESKSAFEKAKSAFFSTPKLENHHLLLEKIAETDSASAIWADAALLSLSARKDGSPEPRELAKKALEDGWQTASRRARILTAIRMVKFNGFDERVLAAMDDADPAVAAVAKETAKALNLGNQEEDKTPIVGTLSPEAAIAAVVDTKGDAALGARMFSRQGCTACHATTLDQPQLGPYLGNIAQTYTRTDLAENILDPGKTIAQGFATELFTHTDGTQVMGFVTLESAELVKVRNIAGQESVWKIGEIAKREKMPISMMPPGLASPLTVREFASLLDYLEELSKK